MGIKAFTEFKDGFDNFGTCLFARTYNHFQDPFVRKDFWEWLSMGWYYEYIYPYDDIYGVERVSKERKLRLGESIHRETTPILSKV